MDFHKKAIGYWVKGGSGTMYAKARSLRHVLTWTFGRKPCRGPWSAAMEATFFTAWIYDHMQPHAVALKVAHPLMLRTVAAAKKKNNRIRRKFKAREPRRH